MSSSESVVNPMGMVRMRIRPRGLGLRGMALGTRWMVRGWVQRCNQIVHNLLMVYSKLNHSHCINGQL